MNKVSMPIEPQGTFKVYAVMPYKDSNHNDLVKQICIHTQYWVSYEDALRVLAKLREYNNNLQLRSTYTIDD